MGDFSSVNVESKLKSVCPNVQLSEVPPINQKRMVAFINHFNIQMVEYLNKFAQSAMQRLFLCDARIEKIEDELSLLEAKLESIPNTLNLPVSVSLSDVTIDSKLTSTDSMQATIDKTEAAPKDDQVTEISSQGSETASSESQVNPELAKYFKMVQVGVPFDAVKLKMKSEGLDPNLLDSS